MCDTKISKRTSAKKVRINYSLKVDSDDNKKKHSKQKESELIDDNSSEKLTNIESKTSAKTKE